MPDDDFDDFLNGLSRYSSFLPADADIPLEILVLRGHLLLEEELRKLIAKKCTKPQIFLLHDRTPFRGLLILTEALYGETLPPWIWIVLRELNQVRNSMAHRLEDKGIQAGVASILKAFEEHDSTYSHVEGGVLQQFNYCLSAMHVELMKVSAP